MAGSEYRIQIGAMVRVGMADEHGIEGGPLTHRQRRGDPIAGVDEEGVAISLDEVATARLASTRVPATSPDHREPHRRRIVAAPDRIRACSREAFCGSSAPSPSLPRSHGSPVRTRNPAALLMARVWHRIR